MFTSKYTKFLPPNFFLGKPPRDFEDPSKELKDQIASNIRIRRPVSVVDAVSILDQMLELGIQSPAFSKTFLDKPGDVDRTDSFSKTFLDKPGDVDRTDWNTDVQRYNWAYWDFLTKIKKINEPSRTDTTNVDIISAEVKIKEAKESKEKNTKVLSAIRKVNRPGGIRTMKADEISAEDFNQLLKSARELQRSRKQLIDVKSQTTSPSSLSGTTLLSQRKVVSASFPPAKEGASSYIQYIMNKHRPTEEKENKLPDIKEQLLERQIHCLEKTKMRSRRLDTLESQTSGLADEPAGRFFFAKECPDGWVESPFPPPLTLDPLVSQPTSMPQRPIVATSGVSSSIYQNNQPSLTNMLVAGVMVAAPMGLLALACKKMLGKSNRTADAQGSRRSEQQQVRNGGEPEQTGEEMQSTPNPEFANQHTVSNSP
eukprot:GHVT01019904.1.p1 GENE.GHVT01019904.1~~GHVT01019904.1.p1  ORF type:complete len:427 (+),score=35.15 GHVT01019904.1:674-1954(+)